MHDSHENDMRVLYISHGAGPLPLMGDQGHVEMVENLQGLASRIGRPSAIVVVSAHWEEALPTVYSVARPQLLYDYYGFPQEAYEIEYPAPGDPELARSLREALAQSGLESREDTERGFDHGLFVPLAIMYPQADIPCVQLSLLKGLNPAAHLALGEALADLDSASGRENLLFVGSGFSFHNMRAFFLPDTPDTRSHNLAFQEWLRQTCAAPELDEAQRKERLMRWESAPHARYCHPREEHLLPLHVCCGAALRPAAEFFDLNIFGKQATAFLW